MDIMKKYRHFVNEAVDSDKELRSMNDVPQEVITTATKIAKDMFDRVRKPTFQYTNDGLIMKFFVTEKDFQYVEEDEDLTLDVTQGAKMKRTYDVTLKLLDKITETFEIIYLVTFDLSTNTMPEEIDDDEDLDDTEDDYYKPDPDDDFDENRGIEDFRFDDDF